MIRRKLTSITTRVLERVLEWGHECSKAPGWTEWDSKTFILLVHEIQDIKRERYEESRSKIFNSLSNKHMENKRLDFDADELLKANGHKSVLISEYRKSIEVEYCHKCGFAVMSVEHSH